MIVVMVRVFLSAHDARKCMENIMINHVISINPVALRKAIIVHNAPGRLHFMIHIGGLYLQSEE